MLDTRELLADVREALASGRRRVTLIYTTDSEYQLARSALLAAGIAIEEHPQDAGGGIIFARRSAHRH